MTGGRSGSATASAASSTAVSASAADVAEGDAGAHVEQAAVQRPAHGVRPVASSA